MPFGFSRHRARPAKPSDIDDDLAFHFEMLVRRYETGGLDRATARERARQRLGDVRRVRDEARSHLTRMETDMDRSIWRQGLWQDVRQGWRALRQAPLVAATALLTIAIGLGANTAMFSVVNGVLLRPLPYRDAGHVVMIWNSYRQAGLSRTAMAAAEFADIKDSGRFDRVAAIGSQRSALTDGCSGGDACEPELANAYVISPDLFDLLGVGPARGRAFTSSDGATGAENVILLSDALWRRRYGGDPSIVGRRISVGGLARTVVGVMPAAIRFPDAPLDFLTAPADLWIPLSWEQRRTDDRGNQYLGILARMPPGSSTGRAQAELDSIASGFRSQFPDRYAEPAVHWRLAAVPLREQMIGDVAPALVLLFAAVGLVLLIACANVANLLLARGAARRREVAVRTALGAARGRLIRQFLIEAMVLVSIGGAAGVCVAAAGLRTLVSFVPAGLPLMSAVSLDARVLSFAFAITVMTGAVTGLLPALRQSSVDPREGLADNERGAQGQSIKRGVRRALVVGEVTMAVVVLVGAGLVVRSFDAILKVDSGFDAAGVDVAQVTLARARYDTPQKVVAFQQSLVDRLAAMPGVLRASAIYPLPMSGEGWSGTLVVESQPAQPGQPQPHAEYAIARPDYFAALGIRMQSGRDFDGRDSPAAAPVAIVDEELARRYWPGQSALGRRISPFGNPPNGVWTTVIGVVAHVRNSRPQIDGEPQAYFPAAQWPQRTMYFVVRTAADPAPLLAPIRASVRAADSVTPVTTLETMPALVTKTVAGERFTMAMLAAFGAVALTLAAVGLYGLMAFGVSERRHEIGIRLALGARPALVVRSILREGLLLTTSGLVMGAGIAFALARSMDDFLFHVAPADPATYATIAAVLAAVAAVACYAPARRATRIDPVEVLR